MRHVGHYNIDRAPVFKDIEQRMRPEPTNPVFKWVFIGCSVILAFLLVALAVNTTLR